MIIPYKDVKVFYLPQMQKWSAWQETPIYIQTWNIPQSKPAVHTLQLRPTPHNQVLSYEVLLIQDSRIQKHLFDKENTSFLIIHPRYFIVLRPKPISYNIHWDKHSGGRLNKKDGLTRYGNSHVKDKTS